MKKLFTALLVVILISFTTLAQLSGPLSGVIEPGNYTIEGNIWVENGESLTLAPGTVFLFEGEFSFDIQGYLYAVGNETDSIKFINSPGSTWKGIDFNYMSDNSSRLEYCLITGGHAPGSWPEYNGGGIYCYDSSPTITNCTISGNTAEGYGGGISCVYSSSPTISNCTISGNSASIEGGGIYCLYSSSPTISNCTISGNSASSDGGGIYCYYSNSSITDCVITGNSAYESGGGIHIYKSDPSIINCVISTNIASVYGGGGIYIHTSNSSITNCTISGNMTEGLGGGGYGGGGIYFRLSSPTVSNCAISGNTAEGHGGGLYCDWQSSPLVSNCTISGNSASSLGAGIFSYWSSPNFINTIVEGNAGSGVYFSNSPDASVAYSDFYNNEYGNFGGNSIPQGSGQIVTANANGDPCDIFFNIFEDPLFIDPLNDDFHLQVGSPCIDGGDPASPLDTDDTIADIGAFYFHQVSAGCIMGQVTPNYAGLTVDLLDNTNGLISSQMTASDGSYSFAEVEAGDYFVELIEPLGFTINQNNVSVTLSGGETITVNFELTATVAANNARSKGYWKHQVNSNLSGKGNPQYSADELEGFSQDIFDHFYLNTVYPIQVAGVTYSGSTFLSLEETKDMLSINQGGSTMNERSCQQLLALLLNVVSDKLGQYALASEDSATVSQAIVYIDEILETESELAKDIAETLNHSQTVGAGVILLTTPYIIFGDEIEGALQPLSYRFNKPVPNPFNPETNLSFVLPEASHVSLVVYDVQGREVARLIEGWQSSGIHKVAFDGSELTSGVYFARLTAGNFTRTQKLLLLK